MENNKELLEKLQTLKGKQEEYESLRNEILLNKMLGEAGWIQNPPNSPDLAYPIETLWVELKKE